MRVVIRFDLDLTEGPKQPQSEVKQALMDLCLDLSSLEVETEDGLSLYEITGTD